MAVVILMAKIPGRKCLLDPRAKEQNLPPTTHFQDSALGEASLGAFTCPSVSVGGVMSMGMDRFQTYFGILDGYD